MLCFCWFLDKIREIGFGSVLKSRIPMVIPMMCGGLDRYIAWLGSIGQLKLAVNFLEGLGKKNSRFPSKYLSSFETEHRELVP